MRVSPAGVVTTVATEGPDGTPLEAPNHVAIAPDGSVIFTDPCRGQVLAYDPATDAVVAALSVDLATQGGPNGVAFDQAGALFFTTENTGFLCQHGQIPITEPLGGLFKTTWMGATFGSVDALATAQGVFGDGLAFDAEGNLYVIFDTAEGVALDESLVMVLPKGGDTLHRFLSVNDKILANLLFGTSAFGETTLYLALLSVPPLVPKEAVGLLRLDVGVTGLPLLP